MMMGMSMRDRDPVDYERSMRSVFVGNIPYEATEDQLKDIFNEVGNVISFRLVFDRESGKPKGYGFAEYQDQETALSAMRNLNQRELHGRQLRVDTATSERNRTNFQEEMGQLGASGPPAESDFGDPTPSQDAPEAISKAVASLPPEQMFELMKQMKQCIQNNPVEARNMLLQNPQLAYALLQAQVVMRIVDPEIAMKMLHRQNPVQPLIPGGDGPRPDQEPRPNGNLPGLGGFPDERPMRDHIDIRDIPVDRVMDRGPPPRGRMEVDPIERVPVDRGDPMERGRGSPLDRHRPPLMDHPDQFGRGDQRHMDKGFMERGGPRDRGPSNERGRGSMEPHGMSPRDLDRPMDRRPPMGRDMPPGPPLGRDGPSGPMGRDLPPMGRELPPMGHPDRGMMRGGFDRMDRPMMDNRGPPRGPPPDQNDPRRGRGPPPPREDPNLPAEQDQEKAALIMQVLQLTKQQIEMLPEEQRQSILALKNQLQG